ncbi:asparaginase [Jannaschia seohaensis]|uniref:Asparaginase n=1 Tax=Jannaschia seohaensis TaxID=475081 RepID=A0A2Y9C8T8_9RHOB|nr:asparaginase [Jannaschia seohaensis]PWJ14486.1 asparaginase [Jannaschia seohaensis]SSA50243.1 asparaginase [Jannaschia seohaensis]
MAGDVELVQVIRGDRVESVHRGHAVICDGAGQVLEAWGNGAAVIYPRSSCKMIQALPLLESGAGRDLTDRHLALACASHRGAPIHTDLARSWLADMGMDDDDLRCGVHAPNDADAAAALIRADEAPCQVHNNCSGKHCGFLMFGAHLGAGPEYVEPDHPVQRAVRAAFEEMTGMESPGYGIDGCSAPNFATRIDALAAAMGRFARPGGDARGTAMRRLTAAMARHPELVSGEGGACTDLMRAMGGKGAVKTGAEGVFIAILPELDRGVAVKCSDGATRAAEAVIATLLMRLGALDAEAPVARRLTHGPITNRRGIETGHLEVTLG